LRSLAELEAALESFTSQPGDADAAERLLAVAEEAVEQWVVARGETPTTGKREGFRLLALHRQGARGAPSFNACRETCREIAYHYNMLCMEPGHELAPGRQRMMVMLVTHLVLFVRGKLQVAGLGEFCCASRPLRAAHAE
jgi:hypothetical protein